MGSFLTRVVSAFIVPLPIAVLLLCTGLGLLWFSRRQKTGKILATTGLGVLLLFSFSVVSDGFIDGLEADHQPLYPRDKLAMTGQQPRWIVVLGSGHAYHPALPPSAQLNPSALARLTEAVRLYRELPGSKLLVCGAAGVPVKHGQTLAAAARSLGVPDDDVVADVSGWDTRDEARSVATRVGDDPFILVTSASHMGRALRIFNGLGKQPIPAPTDYAGLDSTGPTIDDFVPQPSALGNSARAIHEYLGYVWLRLRGGR